MPIRRLTPFDAVAYRALMLGAYAEPSDAFTATVEERVRFPKAWWAARLPTGHHPDTLVMGAFADDVDTYDDDRLLGAAGLRYERRTRTRHKATLFGVYVRPEARGQGLGRALVEAVLDHARADPDLLVVQLRVTATNEAAIHLYRSLGFAVYGTEPYAHRRDDGTFAEVAHLWLPVGEEARTRAGT